VTARAVQGRFSATARLLRVIARLLDGKELDRHEVARLAGIRLAGADRMIRALRTHLPIIEERQVGRRRVIKCGTLAPKKPHIATAVAACFASSLAPLFNGSNYEAGMRDALSHVLRSGRRQSQFTNLDRKFVFARRGGEVSLPDHAGDLDEIVDAILEHKRVRIVYTDFQGATKARTIEPLSIAIYDHQLYVIARKTGGSPRTYRFARISEAEALDDTFIYPAKAEYDPTLMFRDSFGIYSGGNGRVEDVVVRLDSHWKTFSKSHRWHESQETEEHEDHVLIRIRARICPELVGWVLSFGSRAIVVKPRSLRREVITLRRPSSRHRAANI
jgi:predicted DNA-binding transcriptional regulator YafY